MKAKLFTILAVIVLLGAANVQAIPNWDIYSDTDIYSGFYDFINIYDTPPDHTTVNMYGGGSDYITTYDESTLNFFDGSAQIGACDYSIVNITGGTLNGAETYNYGTVYFSGDAYTVHLISSDFGIIDITGGTIERIGALNAGIVNLYAGNVLNRIGASDTSIINIYGHDLVKTDSGGTYGYGQVYGYLTDDTYISVDLSNPEAYYHINLIPEPATILLFGLSGFLLART